MFNNFKPKETPIISNEQLIREVKEALIELAQQSGIRVITDQNEVGEFIDDWAQRVKQQDEKEGQ